MADNVYDAIVIGSGISGGWAAKELCEKGLKTIMLERGENIEHVKDYVNANKEAWNYPHRNRRSIYFHDEKWPQGSFLAQMAWRKEKSHQEDCLCPAPKDVPDADRGAVWSPHPGLSGR